MEYSMIDIKPSVNILGTEYSIKIKKYDEDEIFERRQIDGYCDSWQKEIVICDMSTYPEWQYEPVESIEIVQKEALRHEIVHAFFHESGLDDCSGTCSESWAKNEEMVDWIALQGPKIYKAWESVGAI